MHFLYSHKYNTSINSAEDSSDINRILFSACFALARVRTPIAQCLHNYCLSAHLSVCPSGPSRYPLQHHDTPCFSIYKLRTWM